MSWRMMLGEVVCEIVAARRPENVELALLCAILHPIETHIHSAGALLFDGSIEDAIGGGIVDLHWSGRLRVSHFCKCSADYHSFFSIEKGGSNFCFGGGRDDMFEDFCDVENGSIFRLVGG